MNADPVQIISIVKDFNISIDLLKNKQLDLLNRIKKTVDNDKLLRIKKDLNNLK